MPFKRGDDGLGTTRPVETTLSGQDGRYRSYMLALLALIFAASAADNLALGVVLQNVKSDLYLTDTQLGFVTGIAFAFFYSTMGVPLGRWADRGNRVAIVTITTGLWSLMVILSGQAHSYWELALTRVGVAIGEAGCMPVAYSLIGDYFSKSDRPRALAYYLLGSYIGIMVGYFAAGWLNQIYGWRRMFLLLGLPGIVLATIAGLSLREPRLDGRARRLGVVRPSSSMPGVTPGARASGFRELREAIERLFRIRTYLFLVLALSVDVFFGSGMAQWQPAFFVRSFSLSSADLGLWFSLVRGATGLVGTYFGGALVATYIVGRERFQLRIVAAINALFTLLMVAVFLSRDYHLAFVLIAIATFGGALASAPMFAILQAVVPAQMRAFSIAIFYLFANLIGTGLGSLAVGVLSDMLHAIAGTASLRYALLSMCPGYLLGAWLFLRSSDSVMADMAGLPAISNPSG